MKKLNLYAKSPIEQLITKQCDWSKGKRILIRTKQGLFIGTVMQVTDKHLFILFDHKNKFKINKEHSSIIGEGINRKRRTAIPDEELYLWQKELRLFLTPTPDAD